jgi:ATP-dependent helicase/nuclease subunit A
VSDYRAALNRLRIRERLNWYEWARIGKIKVGAKSRDAVAELQEWALQHDANPAFHEDIRRFTYLLFELADEAIQEFSRYKNERGLIDYIDMETLVNQLLDNPQVKEVLKNEVDLLMVDEFQDTSPIQLSIFHKLSRLVKKSVWVGDPKQSIYGFRGADPRLMQAIIEANGGVKPENVQTDSWRSREELVLATNALFTQAFPGLPEEQVALNYQPKARPVKGQSSLQEPIEMEDALIHWHFIYDGEGRPPGNPWMENSIAFSLKAFLENPPLIYDKEEKSYRPAQPGDVAILCRTNRKCQEMAEALHRAGLKSAIARKGLVRTPEIRLILACLRLLLSSEDSLAVAEVMRLGSAQSLEAIIENRLDFLESSNEQPPHWDGSNELVQKLFRLQGEVVDLSSSEILDLLMEQLELKRVLLRWGASNQRLDNLDSVRQLALQYEQACNRLHAGASLGGFMLWLDSLSRQERDDQSAGEAADCVNVLTYHRSKGLEWPILICHDLENRLNNQLFGLDLIAESEEVDLDDILGNRWLRYWINPYSDQYRNTPLEQRLEGSAPHQAAVERAREEEARLFYVGMTRARDYLIFPTREKPTGWLNRIWHDGQEDHPTLLADSPETPWSWKGKFLHKQTRSFPYPRDFTSAELNESPALFFKSPEKEKTGFEPYRINLHQEWPHFTHLFNPQENLERRYGEALTLPSGISDYDLAKAVKAFLIADHLDYPSEQRRKKAQEILGFHQMQTALSAEQLVQLSTRFFQKLGKISSQKEADMRKYPIRYLHQGRLFETVLDYLYSRPGEITFVQNSSSGGSPERIRQKMIELDAWLFLSGKALQQITGIRRIRPLIHFVLDGLIIEKPVIDLWE